MWGYVRSLCRWKWVQNSAHVRSLCRQKAPNFAGCPIQTGYGMAGQQQCPIPNLYICPWLLSYHWTNSATNFLLLIFDSATMIFRQHSSLPRVLILMNWLMCIAGQGMSNDEDDEEDVVGSSEQLWHRFSFLSYIFAWILCLIPYVDGRWS